MSESANTPPGVLRMSGWWGARGKPKIPTLSFPRDATPAEAFGREFDEAIAELHDAKAWEWLLYYPLGEDADDDDERSE